MNNRLKEIRNNFEKTQKDFGSSLGVSRDTYASYESGRVIPSETFLQLLIKTYNVNYDWLTTGQGDMFCQTKDSLVDKLAIQHNLSVYGRKLIEYYLEMDEEQRKIIDKLLENFTASFNSETNNISVDESLNKTVKVFRAARSDNNSPPQVLEIPVERMQRLKDAPEADEI